MQKKRRTRTERVSVWWLLAEFEQLRRSVARLSQELKPIGDDIRELSETVEILARQKQRELRQSGTGGDIEY